MSGRVTNMVQYCEQCVKIWARRISLFWGVGINGIPSLGVGGYPPAAGSRTVQGVGGYPPGWRRKNCRYIGYTADVWLAFLASRRSGDRCTVGIPREPVWKGCVAARKPERRAGSPFIAPGGLCTRPPHSVTTVMGVT